MELDWLIFPNNGLGTNTILTSSSSSSSSSTLPSPPSLHPFEAQFPEYIDNGITPLIPILRNTTSCDSTDYLHVFDDDDDIDVEVNRHEREHHIDKRLNHEKKEQSSITRHIFKSEKVISSHATSPTSNWTEQAIEQLINNIIDPIGKVCYPTYYLIFIVSS